MRNISLIKKTVAVVVVSVFALFVVLPRNLPINLHFAGFSISKVVSLPAIDFSIGRFNFKRDLNLKFGLDIAGGSRLVFDADMTKITESDKLSAIEATRNTIDQRVNLFGISEPLVQTARSGNTYRIMVELPGVKDTSQAVSLIGQTAKLEFWEVDKKEQEQQKTASGGSQQPKLIPTDLSGADLVRSKITFDSKTGKPDVAIEFSSSGAKKFQEITKRNINSPLAIVLDNQIISAPVVQQEIAGGSAVITGNFSLDEAKKLSIELNAGALPVPIHLVEQQTVEASLGAASIQKSFIAGIIGIGMVIAFMLLFYGRLGFIATLALFAYGVLTIVIYKLLPVVLTLPGIAGFILSVGIAADTNVLIFERMKEELKNGRVWDDAVVVGFKRAWTSIRDANIATIFIVLILLNPLNLQFLHTSGPIRGFAITLGIGVILSLFTGIFVTKKLLVILRGRK